MHPEAAKLRGDGGGCVKNRENPGSEREETGGRQSSFIFHWRGHKVKCTIFSEGGYNRDE